MSDMQWFNEARYGMVIHWGAYSVAARGEWVLNREMIPYNEYIEKYVKNFKAEKFDPREWVKLAKKAGMKYMVFTTRHHDGFALWDTKTTSFNSVNMGPKRDIVREYAEAVREGGLKLGFYFSAADWSHPDYPGPYYRDWPSLWKNEESHQRFREYYNAQLAELMSNYGKVDLLWYDGCIPDMGDGREINAMVKKMQPHILISDRNGEPWDFKCCEQAIRPPAHGIAWEACMTHNDNWGYHAGDMHYKSAQDVVRMLTETAAGAGNLLLNVGPRADGTIPEEAAKILMDVGRWLDKNGEFLAGSSRSPFTHFVNFGRLTTKGNKVYAHLFYSPGEELCIAEIKNKVLSVSYLDTSENISFAKEGNRLLLRGLQASLKDDIATTIVVEVEGIPEPVVPQTTFWIPG